MGAQEQHDRHVRDLMRTRFPLRGDNWRKAVRYLLPCWGKPEGDVDVPYGRTYLPTDEMPVKAYTVLFVYDPAETDRPAFVHVQDVEAARAYMELLSLYVAHTESKEAQS